MGTAKTMVKPDRKNNAPTRSHQPRRILAGFGGLADEIATIDAALALAQALRVDVAGHFVEESNLLDLAGLPFAQAIRASGQSAMPIEISRMKQELAQAASTWRRTLVTRAERSRISCTFRTSTGEYCSEIAKATVESDFVVVNPANVARQGRARARAILDAMGAYAGLVLLPERSRNPKGPVVLFVEAKADNEAYRLAARIAESAHTGLIVVASPGKDGNETALRSDLIEALGPDLQMVYAGGPSSADMIAAVSAQNPSFIVWPGGDGAEDRDLAETLLRSTSAPLLLLRRSD